MDHQSNIQSLAVVGAGTMGAGIAQLVATQGCRVRLIDVDAAVAARALTGITKHLDRGVEKNRMSAAQRDSALARITTGDSISDLDDVDLAIEAVVEDLGVKRAVFQQLERAVSASAILATNTSSLSVGKVADAVKDPTRVIGMHFFNPAPIMPLVEVIAGAQTDPIHIDTAYEAAQSWGKAPVRVKDTPGFIVNRVARGFYLEALRLLDEGVGDVYEIDQVMKRHGQFRMGPFELMDLVGLDVNYSVSTSVWEQLGKPSRLTPHDIQKRLVAAGDIGRKTGQGFYKYENGDALPAVRAERKSFELSLLLTDAMLAFCAKAGMVDGNSTEQYIFARILSAIINEAGIAFGESVASSHDIDLAMIKGTNYPKGPLAWADEIGHHTVRGVLKSLNDLTGDGRYEPATLFVG